MDRISGNPKSARTIWAILLLLLVLTVVTAIRVRLLSMPLERDEGEFAYAGQLLLQGVSPYEAAYNAALKLPGTFAGYAVIMAAFGQTPAAIHAGVILINLATALLVFVLGRRICGTAGGVVAAGTFALLALDPATLGLAAHATHFILLPALAGIVLLQNLEANTPARRILCAGLLLGLATIMKQTGAAFGLFAAVWVAWFELSAPNRHWGRLCQRMGWLALGGALPLGLTCLAVIAKGDFGRFWFWGFQYAGAHGSVFSLRRGVQWMFSNVGEQWASAPGLWSVALLGFGLLLCDRSLQRWRFFIISFAAFSFLAVCPGGYFREHYFIQLLPAAGLLAAVAFAAFSNFCARYRSCFQRQIPALAVTAVMAGALWQWRTIYFFLTPVQACHVIYAGTPFAEAVELSRYVATHCSADARIVVLGSEPEIYFYSHRRAATGYICTYPLVEPQPYAVAMQKEMIEQIEQAKPAYAIFVNIPGSWVQSNAAPDPALFDWFERYRQAHLELVGTVELLPGGQARYRWLDPQTPVPALSSGYWLAIFRDRSATGLLPGKSG